MYLENAYSSLGYLEITFLLIDLSLVLEKDGSFFCFKKLICTSGMCGYFILFIVE